MRYELNDGYEECPKCLTVLAVFGWNMPCPKIFPQQVKEAHSLLDKVVGTPNWCPFYELRNTVSQTTNKEEQLCHMILWETE